MNGFIGKNAKECRVNDIIVIGGKIKKIRCVNPTPEGKFVWVLSDKTTLTIPANITVLVQK